MANNAGDFHFSGSGEQLERVKPSEYSVHSAKNGDALRSRVGSAGVRSRLYVSTHMRSCPPSLRVWTHLQKLSSSFRAQSGPKFTSSSLRDRDLRELRTPAITKGCLCSSVLSSTAGSHSHLEWPAASGAARKRACREPRPRRSRGEGLWEETKTVSCGGFSSCLQWFHYRI